MKKTNFKSYYCVLIYDEDINQTDPLGHVELVPEYMPSARSAAIRALEKWASLHWWAFNRKVLKHFMKEKAATGFLVKVRQFDPSVPDQKPPSLDAEGWESFRLSVFLTPQVKQLDEQIIFEKKTKKHRDKFTREIKKNKSE